MATRAVASAVFPQPIGKVWSAVRDFTFPSKLISTIESAEIEDGLPPTTVGAIRIVKWKTGETRKHRLLELSDQYHKVSWELIESDPPSEVTGSIQTLTLHRVTETNHTLVQWEGDFSSDVQGGLVLFEQKSYQTNLAEVRDALSKI